jgi:flagellin FlaB
LRRAIYDRRGITGLETAIVLIAFVVVAAVFAFAVLTTGLISSEKSAEEIRTSLEKTSSAIQIRGGVILRPNGGLTTVDAIVFQVSSSAAGGGSTNLSSSGTNAVVVTYLDDNQFRNLTSSEWLATWLIGSGNLLDTGERVEITVTLTGLTTLLGRGQQFKIEFKPTAGAVLVLDRTTPSEFKTITSLD